MQRQSAAPPSAWIPSFVSERDAEGGASHVSIRRSWGNIEWL